jgi:hypothetical protein
MMPERHSGVKAGKDQDDSAADLVEFRDEAGMPLDLSRQGRQFEPKNANCDTHP